MGTLESITFKETQSGLELLRGRLHNKSEYATRDGSKFRELTVNITAFGNLATLRKDTPEGALLIVEGRLSIRKYQDNVGNDRWITEIVCSDIQVLEVPVSESAPADDKLAETLAEESKKNPNELGDDDIPF
jgi:single-strand DNA-binding protein